MRIADEGNHRECRRRGLLGYACVGSLQGRLLARPRYGKRYRMPPSYSTDIVIFGGGAAGLWLLNRLSAAGYRTILLERGALGGGQSIHAQGIIHGGLKYALHGAFSGASRAIAEMPARWRECIAGSGEIDLSACKLSSPHFYLWSGEGLGGGMKAFLGSKAVAGGTEVAAEMEIPVFLRGRGVVYRLPDFVVDTHSLIRALAQGHAGRIFTLGSDGTENTLTFERTGGHRELQVQGAEGPLRIKARRYVFCAGEGNQALSAKAGLTTPRCQLRPLKMVSISRAALPEVFLHVLGAGLGATPRLTITSHRDTNNNPVWYLGGDLAETGVERTDARQIDVARAMLAELLPDAGLDELEWRCLDINRAEPESPGGRRPDNASLCTEQDVIVAWPVKLALAPVLADQVMHKLREDGIEPGNADGPGNADSGLLAGIFPGSPAFARPFWN